MTKLLDMAVDRARTLPPDLQDDIARMVLSLAGDSDEPVVLTLEEDAAIVRSIEAADRGEFATEAQLRAVWSKYGL
jgi:hypothetical protein